MIYVEYCCSSIASSLPLLEEICLITLQGIPSDYANKICLAVREALLISATSVDKKPFTLKMRVFEETVEIEMTDVAIAISSKWKHLADEVWVDTDEQHRVVLGLRMNLCKKCYRREQNGKTCPTNNSSEVS